MIWWASKKEGLTTTHLHSPWLSPFNKIISFTTSKFLSDKWPESALSRYFVFCTTEKKLNTYLLRKIYQERLCLPHGASGSNERKHRCTRHIGEEIFCWNKKIPKNPVLPYTGWRSAVSIWADEVFSFLCCRLVMATVSVLCSAWSICLKQNDLFSPRRENVLE